ncbi:MAG: hypothetical protein EOO68_16575 [Moraxellaceae bacterium]|nr:MAG: hypothetical protein EOO68_16575 [Moraxellaceae bacterium]
MYKLLLPLTLMIIASLAQAQSSDPTKPLGHVDSVGVNGVASADDGIQLMSILIGDDRRLAIINGQSLQESQKIKGVGATVKKIEPDAVTLQQGEKVWRVPLNTTVVRNTKVVRK